MVDVGDSECNFVCGRKVHEYVGPVKILLVDPPKNEYFFKTWFAALLSFANALVSVNFILAFMHTMAFKTKFAMTGHIYLCTLGFQYFMFTGILLINGLFGPAAPLTVHHRKLQHIALIFIGLLTGAAGIFIVYSRSKTSLFSTVHSVAGLGTFVFGFLSALVGSATSCFNVGGCGRMVTKTHNILGSLTVAASSICFILGIMKPVFIKYMLLDDMYLLMIVFCVVYTLIVILSPVMKNSEA